MDDVTRAITALLPKFRKAFAAKETATLWAIARECTGNTVTLNSIQEQEERTLDDHTVAHHTYFAGSVGIGKSPSSKAIQFSLQLHGEDTDRELKRFISLARQGGAAILSRHWLQRLNVSSSHGPVPLWLAFVLQFAFPDQRKGYRIIRGLYAQSILAIERAAQREVTDLASSAGITEDITHVKGHGAVMLQGRNSPALVRGKPKKLNSAQYDLIEQLINARPTGLTKSSIEKLRTDARGILNRLRNDPDWAAVIHMAGVTSGRYRID